PVPAEKKPFTGSPGLYGSFSIRAEFPCRVDLGLRRRQGTPLARLCGRCPFLRPDGCVRGGSPPSRRPVCRCVAGMENEWRSPRRGAGLQMTVSISIRKKEHRLRSKMGFLTRPGKIPMCPRTVNPRDMWYVVAETE